MKTLVVYHDPACSNSRRAIELLNESVAPGSKPSS